MTRGAHSWRRMAVGLTIAALLLGVGVRSVTMFWFSSAGAAAYGDARYEAAATSFGRLEPFELIEPWRADLGRGDALYRQGDLVAAAGAFAAALADEPGRCDLRFNLAVTLEAQGDRLIAGESLDADAEAADGPFDRNTAGGPPADPGERYRTALNTIAGRPCPIDPDAGPDDPAVRLDETRQRIEAKLAALDDTSNDNTDRDEVEESADQDRSDGEQIDQLQQRNNRGAAQREAGQSQDATGGYPDGQSNW